MTYHIKEFIEQNPWTATLVIALISVILGWILRRAVRAVLLRASAGVPFLEIVLKAVEPAAGAALPLTILQAVWTGAPDNLAYIQNVRHFNGLLLVGAFTWLVISLITAIGDAVVATHPVNVEDNIEARRIQTQAKVFSRSAMVVVLIAGVAIGLMTFPGARQLGASLLASAGVVGLVGGLAARPVFSNLIAGLQLALAQPIRLDDVLVIKGEWGRVEEITGTYVVLKIWDERRLIVPLQWFIENPFENWTRHSSQLLGSVFLQLDFSAPLDELRAELQRLVQHAPEWDGRVCELKVTDASDRALQVRILLSASNSGKMFDLRCRIREALLAFMAREHPHSLPHTRWQSPEEYPGRSRDQESANEGRRRKLN
jgi:small-conductance mechanosensitive channel